MKKTLLISLWVLFHGMVQAFPQDSEPRLPLVIIPAVEDARTPLVLFISGDGGWKDFDPKLAKQFVAHRSPVVALNALHYFWDRKSPEQATAVVASLLDHYMKQWGKRSFILVGFSFGADVMPFVVNRLPKGLVKDCRGVALFSPSTSTDFEIHIAQMLSSRRQWKYNVVQEIRDMPAVRTLCFFGEAEHEFPVKAIAGGDRQVIYLKGGHHYEQNTDDVARIVFEALGIQ